MQTSTKRALTPLAVAGALVLTCVPPASAADFSLTLPEGMACEEFAVRLDVDAADRVTRQIPDKKGLERYITAGRGHILTFTRVEPDGTDSESVTVTTGGSVQHETVNDDGTRTVKATGKNVVILFPTDKPKGPSTVLYTGQVTYTYIPGGGPQIPGTDPVDNLHFDQNVSLTSKGKQRDICAELS